LELEVTDPMITPAFKEPCSVPKKPIQFLEGCHPSNRAMPCISNNLHEALTTGPKRQEVEPSSALIYHASMQQ
jgi:hypothetical protein